jgi:hypothetical protein
VEVRYQELYRTVTHLPQSEVDGERRNQPITTRIKISQTATITTTTIPMGVAIMAVIPHLQAQKAMATVRHTTQ